MRNGLQAPDGQQINMTLMDYTPVATVKSSAGDAAAGWCPVIVQLREVSESDGQSSPRKTVVRACDSRLRKRLIYTSRGSHVRVTMPLTRRPLSGNYILYFEGTD